MVAEYLTRPVFVELGGVRWRLIFTHRVLLECERETGADLFGAPLEFSGRVIRGLLWASFANAGGEWTPDVMGRQIERRDIPRLQNTLIDGWLASMPEPETKKTPSVSKKKLAWPDAWASAREDLRLSDDDWLDSTPRMIEQLWKQHMENIRERELMLSRVAAATANFSMAGPQKQFKDDHFMLHPWPPPPEPVLGEMTEEEVMKIFEPLRRKR